MKIRQSAAPYLFLLLLLLVGIPVTEKILKTKSAEAAIVIKVNNMPEKIAAIKNFKLRNKSLIEP